MPDRHQLARTALELWFHDEVTAMSRRREKLPPSDDLSAVRTAVPRAEALRLRRRFDQALQEHIEYNHWPQTPDELTDMMAMADEPGRRTASDMAMLMDHVLSGLPGHEPIDEGDRYRRPKGLNDAIRRLGEWGRQGARPVSPFDPRWCDTHAMQEAGSRLRFTSGTEIVEPDSGDEVPVWASAAGAGRGVDPLEARLNDREDRLGLSVMRPWLTDDDFQTARRVLLATGADGRDPSAVERSVAMLRELVTTGEAFRLEQERPGQLAARLGRSDVLVRIADVTGNRAEPLIGRAYGDGMEWRLSQHQAREEGRYGYVLPVPTTDQVVLPLRQALGKPLDGSRSRLDAVRPAAWVWEDSDFDGDGYPGFFIVQPAVDGSGLYQVFESMSGDEDGEIYATDGMPLEEIRSRIADGRIYVPGGIGFDGLRRTTTVLDSGHHWVDLNELITGPVVPDSAVAVRPGYGGERGMMVPVGGDLHLRSEVRRRPAQASFATSEAAWDFLGEQVTSARDSLFAELDADGIIAQFDRAGDVFDEDAFEAGLTGEDLRARQQEAFDEWPWRLSDDPAIADVQRGWLDVLRDGRRTNAPGDVQRDAYDLVNSTVGRFRPVEVDERAQMWFDPDMVARWSSRSTSPMAALEDLKTAVRTIVNDPGETVALETAKASLLGDPRRVADFCDDLLAFDPSSVRSATESRRPDGVRQAAVDLVEEALERQGLTDAQALMDANGVISWTATRQERGRPVRVTGQVGQVFEPDGLGGFVTGFAGGNDHYVVPGYRATVLPQGDGPEQTMEQRTVLSGYREEVLARIQRQLAVDATTPSSRVAGGATCLNDVYRTMFDVRYPANYLDQMRARGQGELAEAAVRTQAGRVRYPDWVSDTMYESWAAQGRPEGRHVLDAVGQTGFALGGYRNRTVLSPESDGFFDPVMTTDSASGVTRFLTSDARVVDGRIVPGDVGGRAPVAELPYLETCDYDAFDRRRMTLMNALTATRVTEPAMAAQVPLAGWTMEDGIVVSREFAEANMVADDAADGALRPLKRGDKLSDLHGNKGVVSLVVDRSRFPDGSDPLLDEAVQLFRDNPSLDVVMSPFGALSRFNAGIPHEAVEGAVPLVGAAGAPLPSGAEMGPLRMVVTDKSVSAGTRVYADEPEPGTDEDFDPLPPVVEHAVGGHRGRKASGQLAWALQARGCDAVMAQLYRYNAAAVADLREYAGLFRLGVDDAGTLLPERFGVEDRRVIEVAPLLDGKGALHQRATRAAFAEATARHGGDLLLPFPLSLPDGRTLEEGPRPGTWRLPVLSSHLRRPVPGGAEVGHEYSGIYERCFMAAAAHRVDAERLASGKVPPADVPETERAQRERVATAQRQLDALLSKVRAREFEGRHNAFRDGVMTAQQGRSATAVWSGDPRLDLDQVGVPPEMAKRLGVGDGDRLLVWRDPVLRDSGVRYLRVKLDDELVGVSVNPMSTKSFDGDFDGDSVGLVALPQPGPDDDPGEGRFAAHRQALARLTPEANLVDFGRQHDDAALGYEVSPLAFQTGADVKASGADLSWFLKEANEVAADLAGTRAALGHGDLMVSGPDGEPLGWSTARWQEAELLERGRLLVASLSETARQSLRGMSTKYGLVYSDAGKHLESVRRTCVDTGAKGDGKVLKTYERYLSVDWDDGEGYYGTEQLSLGTSRRASQESNAALVVKKAVGIPGAQAQRAVTALRDADLEAALELTAPCTDSMMQVKHDASSAMARYGLMQTVVRELWRGRRIGTSYPFATATDEKGRPVQATRDQWVEQALALYRDPRGLNVPDISPEMVERTADALAGPNGTMNDVEAYGELDPARPFPEGAARSGALDRLAYRPSLEAFYRECRAGSSLFSGRCVTFAPGPVARNLKLLQYEADRESLFDGTDRSLDDPATRVVDHVDLGGEEYAIEPVTAHVRPARFVEPPEGSKLANGTVVGHVDPTRPAAVGRADVLADGRGGKARGGGRTAGATRPASSYRAAMETEEAQAAADDREPGD